MTYAQIYDVSTRLGRPITSTEETQQVLAWLEDIEALILTRVPTLPARITANEVPIAVVVMVEANAVIRKIKNPDGKVSEGVDDYNYRLNENSRKGELFLTDEEWDLLSPGSPDGAFSVRPYFEPDTAAWPCEIL